MRMSFVTALLSSMAGAVGAQAGPPSELIPRALVEGLLSSVYGGTNARPPEIVVGALPPAIQSKLILPSDARVLGGMIGVNSSTAIVMLSGPLNSVGDAFSKGLLANGWEVMDQAPMRFYGSEFIDAPSGQRRTVSGAPETYCGKAGTMMVRYEPDGFTQTRVILTTYGVNRCAEMRDMMLRSRMSMGGARENRPTLVNPGAARNQQGICPSYNSGFGGQGTELSSAMSPQDILAHYAKQLADSGWKSAGTGVTAAWTRTDTSGVVSEYQITVRDYPLVPVCRKVESELRARVGR